MTMNTIATTPISNEARGRVRQFLEMAGADAGKMAAAIKRIPLRQRDPRYWRGNSGARLAIQRIEGAMPRPPDLRRRYAAVWRFLQPVEALPAIPGAEAAPTRPGVVVMGIVAARRGLPCQPRTFGLGATFHGLGRAVERSGFRADLAASLFAAHSALLALDVTEGREVFNLPSVVLPGGGGTFLATPIAGRDPICICRTWLDVDQVHADQAADLSAWATLMGLDAG
jgi:hypothetical protein